MDQGITWLRLSYFTGALIDGLAAVQMLFPSIFAVSNGLANFNPPVEYRYAMGMGASLMLGWTLLLLWASQKPLERKAILLITIFPVIFGLVVNEVGAVITHFISAQSMLPIWILQAVLAGLFAFSYLYARNRESS